MSALHTPKEANRFYTIMVIPEKSSQVRKFLIPAWVIRTSFLGVFFITLLGSIMLLDYWYVMGQISENKSLKLENRRLKQQVQVFKNKMSTVEATMDRVRTFATRLKVITNIEDRQNLLQSLNQKLPDAASNIGTVAAVPLSGANGGATSVNDPASGQNPAQLPPQSPEEVLLQKDNQELDAKFSELTHESLLVEQLLQDQYELLADQKAFLAALPTRKPAVGYFTSGFGVRRSPYGSGVKMHEGIDIANHPGTSIKAPADGTVLYAAVKPGYGQTVILDHGYGLETWYGHARQLLVKSGQKIRRGDSIALLGNSGRSTGPHVHYEVRINGTPVDPLPYILEN